MYAKEIIIIIVLLTYSYKKFIIVVISDSWLLCSYILTKIMPDEIFNPDM